MAVKLILLLILLLSISCVLLMIHKLRQQASSALSLSDYVKLISSGVLAFISDTIGVGSFAVNIALAKLLGTFHDDELPAMTNGAQVLPGMLESLFFIQIMAIDLTTLITLVAGTCLGGLIGGSIISRLSKQSIRFAMIACFILILSLLLAEQLHLTPIGGHLTELRGSKLIIGFLAMIVCGSLTSAGIGLFAMIQGALFLMNVSPAVAFPIMTTAGAMQQPLTTFIFLQQNKIPLKKTLILALAGCIGVFIALPIVSHLNASWLHRLLILIMCYNLLTIGRDFLRAQRPLNNSKPD